MPAVILDQPWSVFNHGLSDLFDVNFDVIIFLNLNGRVAFIVMPLLMVTLFEIGQSIVVLSKNISFMTREKVTYRLRICSWQAKSAL